MQYEKKKGEKKNDISSGLWPTFFSALNKQQNTLTMQWDSSAWWVFVLRLVLLKYTIEKVMQNYLEAYAHF